MTIYFFLFIMNFLALSLFLFTRIKKGGIAGLLTKIIASVSFILLGFGGLYSYNVVEPFGLLILLGLIFGLIGDIVLDLKIIYRESKIVYLNSGMIFFGLGHLLYILSIINYNILNETIFPKLRTFSFTLLLSLIIIITILSISKKINLNFGKFYIHSILYSFVLIFVMVLSFILSYYSLENIIFAFGFLLFLISDLFLSIMYFKEKIYDKKLIFINHFIYYSAQITIASFMYFI